MHGWLAGATLSITQHWVEAVQQMPVILQNLYAQLPEGPHDWCLLADKTGTNYFCEYHHHHTPYCCCPTDRPRASSARERDAEALGGLSLAMHG